jgi:hypothetical protein
MERIVHASSLSGSASRAVVAVVRRVSAAQNLARSDRLDQP